MKTKQLRHSAVFIYHCLCLVERDDEGIGGAHKVSNRYIWCSGVFYTDCLCTELTPASTSPSLQIASGPTFASQLAR